MQESTIAFQHVEDVITADVILCRVTGFICAVIAQQPLMAHQLLAGMSASLDDDARKVIPDGIEPISGQPPRPFKCYLKPSMRFWSQKAVHESSQNTAHHLGHGWYDGEAWIR